MLPEVRGAKGFSVLPEGYFSGSENVTEFLEGIDNQIRLLEIPSDLSCAYVLKPQVQDYAEGRNPQNTVQLLEVLSKFEERYSCKGSRNSDNVERRGWNKRRVSHSDDSLKNWRNSKVLR
ncbi:uncharacterized protein TNCV_4144201 [Trichonephila clavipes]|nr:uncharacterized protein TNCV_4144201 [Trichonephila clavipes]